VNLTAPIHAYPGSHAAHAGAQRRLGCKYFRAGRRGWANVSAHCAKKFALTGLTQALAAEGRNDGIRVCVLYPGAMSTSWGHLSQINATLAALNPPTSESLWIRQSLRPSSLGWQQPSGQPEY
jgi:NAD(P)-dependent dehydrogenase (short-subunit alcohol dehydrogenase family)